MKVIVVGAGAAGLAAVHHLRRAGVDVIAFESSAQAGGRLAGERRDGFTLDLGAQFFFDFYDTTFALCRELGLGDDIVPFPMRMAMARDGVLHPVTVTPDLRVLWRERRDLARFRGVPVSALLQAARIAPLLFRRRHGLHFLRPAGALDLDDESLADFVRRRGGNDALEYLFQPVASAMTLGGPEEIGTAYGLALLWYTLNGLYTLRGGIGSLAGALHARHASCVHLSTPVRRILTEGGRVRGVVTDSGPVGADAVICATTATQVQELLPSLPASLREPLARVTYSTCCHAIFGMPAPVLPAGCYAVGLPRHTGSPLAGITDNAMKSPGYAPPGCALLHAFGQGEHARRFNALGDAEIAEGMLAEMRRFLPDLPRKPLFAQVCRWDEAVCLSPPGMLAAMEPLRGRGGRCDGGVPGLFLAGEYLYMPSVDGALQSGVDAAAAVVRAGR